MRVVFMGTPEFAVPTLKALAREHDLVAVYTRADSASGRGRQLHPSPAKEAAVELGIEVHQPRTLREPAEHERLVSLRPDVIVVAAYGLILPPEVLDIPDRDCINVHASLLPRWRGAAPIQRAILAGDALTGVSIMRMEEGLDTGPYCEMATTAVADKNADVLTRELAVLGAHALLRTLDRIESGLCVWTPQDETLVTYADKIQKHELELSPALEVGEALRRVRAATAQAPARLTLGGRCATVLDADESETDLAPGCVACQKHALVVGLANGSIMLDRVKPDGKAEMRGCDWARGARFTDDARWELPT